MNAMKYTPTFKRALELCKKRLEESPTFPPLRAIEKQLEYLIELDEGRRADFERLQEINLGLLAAREFEPHDMEFANQMYEVMDAVDNLKFGR